MFVTRYMATPFHYVYVLLSKKDGLFYVGSTESLKERLARHDKGQVQATKSRLPMELIFFEGYKNKFDALRREDYFKTTKGKRTLRITLAEFFNSC